MTPANVAGPRPGSLRSEPTVFGPSIGDTILVDPSYYRGRASLSVSWTGAFKGIRIRGRF